MSVIIPRRTQSIGSAYFTPRYVKIAVGQNVTWHNPDTENGHSLIFNRETPPYGIKIGDIAPGGSLSKKFDHYIPMIDYMCALHPEERGFIVIYPKNEIEMSNTETLRHLTGAFGLKNPSILSHLDHKSTKYGKTIGHNASDSPITVERLLDPSVYARLGNPDLYQLRNLQMTIVFWDISGFSDLCNTLKNEPVLIAGFLRDYLDLATELICRHGGTVDKFIGDGILALFGLVTNDPMSAVECAVELREKFESMKKTWIGILSKDFGYTDIRINIKCGIHCGEVLVGLTDTNKRTQLTIVGSTINLASRIESEANEDQIMVSKEVKDYIPGKYVIDEIEIKEPIKSFPEIKVLYVIQGKRITTA